MSSERSARNTFGKRRRRQRSTDRRRRIAINHARSPSPGRNSPRLFQQERNVSCTRSSASPRSPTMRNAVLYRTAPWSVTIRSNSASDSAKLTLLSVRKQRASNLPLRTTASLFATPSVQYSPRSRSIKRQDGKQGSIFPSRCSFTRLDYLQSSLNCLATPICQGVCDDYSTAQSE